MGEDNKRMIKKCLICGTPCIAKYCRVCQDGVLKQVIKINESNFKTVWCTELDKLHGAYCHVAYIGQHLVIVVPQLGSYVNNMIESDIKDKIPIDLLSWGK